MLNSLKKSSWFAKRGRSSLTYVRDNNFHSRGN
jgi:hypothetical protein